MTDSSTPEKQHTEGVFGLLSDTQWRFVTAMMENPAFTKKEAAEHIGITPDTAYRWPAFVNDAIEQARANIHAAALSMRRQAILKAIAVKVALLDSNDETVRSKAASEIIEWELGKAVQRSELTGQGGNALEVVIKYEDAADDDYA